MFLKVDVGAAPLENHTSESLVHLVLASQNSRVYEVIKSLEISESSKRAQNKQTLAVNNKM